MLNIVEDTVPIWEKEGPNNENLEELKLGEESFNALRVQFVSTMDKVFEKRDEGLFEHDPMAIFESLGVSELFLEMPKEYIYDELAQILTDAKGFSMGVITIPTLDASKFVVQFEYLSQKSELDGHMEYLSGLKKGTSGYSEAALKKEELEDSMGVIGIASKYIQHCYKNPGRTVEDSIPDALSMETITSLQ